MPSEKSELIAVLTKLWEHYPHWRFGQLVCNVAGWAGGDKPGEAGDVSDQESLKAALAHLARVEPSGAVSQRAAI